MTRTLTTALCLLLTACGEDGAGAPQQRPPQQGPTAPQALEHDFGVIPHGESRTFDYVLDLSAYDITFVPLRVQLDCSCGHGQLVLRAADGSERVVDGRPYADNAPQPGETLIARVVIDTLTKDPVDLPKATSRGYVVLQPIDDMTGLSRINWPLLLHFGIDCPVQVKPFATLEFEKVPLSAQPTISLELAGDDAHPGVRFGPVQCSDPALSATLESEGDRTRLRVRCTPAVAGSHRAVVRVETDIAGGYAVNLGATWKVVPDLEAYPLDKLSFRAHLERAQTAEEAGAQYLQLADHDQAREVEFRVREIVGDDGRDRTSCFEVTFAPIRGEPRHRRLYVRYLGGLEEQFRGRIVLTAGGEEGPLLPISLVVFPITS